MDESVDERIARRESERKKLLGEIYKHFIKDNMTSEYQSRIIKIFELVKKNKIHSLNDAIKYYNNLKTIKVQRSRIID